MSICSETYTKLRAKFGTCRKLFQQLPRKTDYLCVLYCRECYQLKRKKVKILGLGAFFALTLVAMEQNQKTLVRLSKQNKTREEHKKLSIFSAKKGMHTCRICIVCSKRSVRNRYDSLWISILERTIQPDRQGTDLK